ncbi:Agamous-like MADS-box protein AGL80 [Glycine soja]|uniref:Agamous-like MADS-box protein AGL80 n=1 Tax=Glycine soja TaxID=3848 RepID=A0A445FPH2_GLYSO|nr:Agamous-like MADS-box protein AGL80 [Glycine soja]
MTRKKVQPAFISYDSARKLTYKKMKKGMLKKIDEPSTLCGIEACAIVWPSHWGVQRVLEKFMSMPELEQSKKMVNQESFTAQRIMKGNKQMMKLMKDNRRRSRARPDNNMTTANLNFLSWMVDQNLKNIDKRMETLKVNEMTQNIQPQMQTPALNYALGSDMNTAEPMQTQWFMDFLNNGDGDERLIMPAFGDANNPTPNWLLSFGGSCFS